MKISVWNALLDHILILKEYVHKTMSHVNNLIKLLENVKLVTQVMNYHQNIHVSNLLPQSISTHFVHNGTVLECYVYLVQRDHFSTILAFVKDLILCVKLQIKWMDIAPAVMMVMVLISMENVFIPKMEESVTHFAPNSWTTFVQNALLVHTSTKTMSVNQLILIAPNLILFQKHVNNVILVMLLFLVNVKLIQHIHLVTLIVLSFQMESVSYAHLDTILKKMENVQLLIHYVQLSIKWMDNVKAVSVDMLYSQVFVFLLKILQKIPTVLLST